jgi:hypothetical protein
MLSLQFIDLYRRFEVLWKPRNSDCKQRNEKSYAQGVLVKEMTGERSDIQRRLRKKFYHFTGV